MTLSPIKRCGAPWTTAFFPQTLLQGVVILAAKDLRTNTDNVFYTLCDAASILLPDSLSKPEWAITSPTFTQHKRTLLTPDGKTILELD